MESEFKKRIVVGVDMAKANGDKTVYCVHQGSKCLYCGNDKEKAIEIINELEEDNSPDFDSDDDLRKMYGSSLAHAKF